MDTYEWFRFETKEVVQRKSSTRLRELLKEATYNHTDKPGLTYNIMLHGSLRNDVITNIIYYMLAQCNMAGEIAHIRYYQVNKSSPS